MFQRLADTAHKADKGVFWGRFVIGNLQCEEEKSFVSSIRIKDCTQ